MQTKTFHIVGICGIGMSAIAQVLKSLGYNVQGSDNGGGKIKETLLKIGITVFSDHKAQNIKGADVLIHSSAINNQNVEVLEAKRQKKTILQRFQILQKILKDKNVIAISGCHGKTTTTAIIGEIFINAGLDPTIICGGIMNRFGNNVKIGKSKLFIIEADESDNTFNKIPNNLAVVTNIKSDHLDFYKNKNAVREKFIQFIANSNAIAPYSSSGFLQSKKNLVFYDFNCNINKKKLTSYQCSNWSASFRYEINNKIEDFSLSLPGMHNVENAMAAICCANHYSISIDTIKKSLIGFCGVKRRLSFIGEFLGNKIIDDYAHHPDEIIATLKMLNNITKNIIAVIQPHKYTRAESFFDLYVQSLTHAKHVILLDVFSAGEQNNGFDSAKIYNSAVSHGMKNVILHSDTNMLGSTIVEINQKNGLIVFMGAGDVTLLAHNFASYA